MLRLILAKDDTRAGTLIPYIFQSAQSYSMVYKIQATIFRSSERSCCIEIEWQLHDCTN